MNDIVVKICDKHGVLTDKETLKENRPSGVYLRCAHCRREKDRIWKINNRDKHRASASRARNLDRTKANEWARNDRVENPEKYRTWAKEYRARQPKGYRITESLKEYNLTREKYDQMVAEQENKCAICGKEETRKSRTPGEIARLCIDHCHKTGFVRALLCHACNLVLGASKDSTDILKKCIEYLNKKVPEPEVST